MLRAMGLIGVLLVASSCGKAKTLELGQFEKYVTAYEKESQRKGSPIVVDDLKIEFGPMEQAGQRGLCIIVSNQTPLIRIDQAGWARMSETTREVLLFHELGHCTQRRNHDTDEVNGVPESMMHPFILQEGTYRTNRDYYLGELYSVRNQF